MSPDHRTASVATRSDRRQVTASAVSVAASAWLLMACFTLTEVERGPIVIHALAGIFVLVAAAVRTMAPRRPRVLGVGNLICGLVVVASTAWLDRAVAAEVTALLSGAVIVVASTISVSAQER